MNIAIDGTSGSGKGTLAKNLATKLSMDGPFSGGGIMRQMAQDAGVTLEEFQKIAHNDPQFDVTLDEKLHQLSLTHGNAVFEGRLTAFFCRAQVRIYLDCPLEIRAQRVASRDHQTPEEAAKALAFRDRTNQERYQNYYGITLGDPSQYNIFLDSAELSPEELTDIMIAQITEKSDQFVTFNGKKPQLVSQN
jgi:cytidylate kinase